MRFGTGDPRFSLVRRRRRDVVSALTERAVAAKLHPHTGLVHPFTNRPPVEVRHAADPDDRRREGPAAP